MAEVVALGRWARPRDTQHALDVMRTEISEGDMPSVRLGSRRLEDAPTRIVQPDS
jgi:hypothetical protein